MPCKSIDPISLHSPAGSKSISQTTGRTAPHSLVPRAAFLHGTLLKTTIPYNSPFAAVSLCIILATSIAETTLPGCAHSPLVTASNASKAAKRRFKTKDTSKTWRRGVSCARYKQRGFYKCTRECGCVFQVNPRIRILNSSLKFFEDIPRHDRTLLRCSKAAIGRVRGTRDILRSSHEQSLCFSGLSQGFLGGMA